MDGVGHVFTSLINRAGGRLNKLARKDAKVKKMAKSGMAAGKKLALTSWQFTWRISAIQTQCAGAIGPVCIKISNLTNVSGFDSSVTSLNAQLRQLTELMKKYGRADKKFAESLEKNGDRELNFAKALVQTVPAASDSCS